MSEPSNSAWPFSEITNTEGLDIDKIFGTGSGTASQGNPFEVPAAAEPSIVPSPAPVVQEAPAVPLAAPAPAPAAAPADPAPKAPAPAQPTAQTPAENPIAAAFEQKAVENTKQGLLEKPPVFYHKGVKEDIEDASMTFEELRIRKSEDFTDLEEGKRVSWSVEYCGIRKEVKDPKGTTIISMKEMIERSREFLDALKKTKDKNPCCYVKPKVEMKTKGNDATYKGKFGSLEEARASDKVICLIPSNDGRIYELRKMEQGEFIAPKNNVIDFSEVRAGFTPALPKIPARLMGQIIAFFRTFMTESEENEALALIYWDKVKKEFFAYVPKQSVCKVEIEANLHDCPYDDAERYICYSSRRTKEMVILLGCVDNNKTRQLCHQAFYQSENLIYIDSGNGKYTGQVVCGVRKNGHTMRKPIGGVHPEMLKDTDKFPSELSCAEAAQEDPQSIVQTSTAVTCAEHTATA